MGKKYIIELLDDCQSEFKGIMAFGLTQEKQISVELIPEESLRPYTEPDLDQVRKEAYKDGYDASFGRKIDASYQEGLSDAWEAARKIWENDMDTLQEIFGWVPMRMDVFLKYTASECIEKIRQYEQDKEEIKVGDEVELKCGVRHAIYMQGTKGSDEIYLLFKDGSCGLHSKSEIERKTGRHFPEIATIREKMREGQE